MDTGAGMSDLWDRDAAEDDVVAGWGTQFHKEYAGIALDPHESVYRIFRKYNSDEAFITCEKIKSNCGRPSHK
jgi:hypothetical protein